MMKELCPIIIRIFEMKNTQKRAIIEKLNKQAHGRLGSLYEVHILFFNILILLFFHYC